MVELLEEFLVQVSVRSFAEDSAAVQENNIFPSRIYTNSGGVCFRKYRESENATVENRKLGRAQILGLIGKLCGGNTQSLGNICCL